MRKLNSLNVRLFLLFLSCMMALILAFGVLYYHKLTGIIHNQTEEMAEKNISQTVDLFDLLLKGYDSLTKSLNSNYEMLRLIKERDNGNSALNVINERTITNNLGAVYYSRDDIISIHVITNGGINYDYERRFAGVVDAHYADKEWYSKLKQSTGEMVWLGLFQGSVLNSMQQDTVFVFGRQLYDLTDHSSVGIVIFETDPNPILSALSNASLTQNSKAYITDRDNRIIASTNKDAVQPMASNDASAPSDAPVLDMAAASAKQLVVSAMPTLADWTVSSLTPKSDISARIAQTRQYLIVVIAALVVLSIVLATIISRTIASPLKLLIREMRQVEMGNFRGSVNVRSFDEINSLVASFNRMVNRMDELIERITAASVSEKNAELAALQSQVNPHFLYNTLDMIYWMLDERGNDKLGKVILALSHMFRYSSDWEEASKTTLRHELEQMKQYMTIIENRLAGRVLTIIDIEEEWLDAVIPKMTLQPIIENAVKSGLEPMNRPGEIRVFTKVEEQEFHLIIQDNGVGMDEDTLKRLQESLREGTASSGRLSPGRVPGYKGLQEPEAARLPGRARRGIGLTNVHRRLVLQFGDAYGLRISSILGQGTTVTIVMPMPTLKG